MRALDASHDGATITLAAGEMIELRLEENPTTGFRWRIEGAPACRVTEDFFEPGPKQAGAGGTHVWRITADGDAELVLAYARPWDGRPARRFAVHIRVAASRK
jgi:inhibitor of cysteine peptidase